MAQATEHFQVGDVRFWFKRVSLEDGCLSLRLLGESMGMAAGRTLPDYVAALTRSIDRVPQLVALFAGYCEVEGPGIGAGRRVALKPFIQETFAGHIDRALLFIANCSAIEHADFLDDRLLGLGAGVADLVQRFPALAALIPSSGDSSSADTSKTA